MARKKRTKHRMPIPTPSGGSGAMAERTDAGQATELAVGVPGTERAERGSPIVGDHFENQSPPMPVEPLRPEQFKMVWDEYKDQNDWQRHNESQRAAITNILIAISGAIMALFFKDGIVTSEWSFPLILLVIGILGNVVIAKYWERFMYHVWLERSYRRLLDSQFPKVQGHGSDENNAAHIFLATRYFAKDVHSQDRDTWLKDDQLRQHTLWRLIFGLIGLVGIIGLLLVWRA